MPVHAVCHDCVLCMSCMSCVHFCCVFFSSFLDDMCVCGYVYLRASFMCVKCLLLGVRVDVFSPLLEGLSECVAAACLAACVQGHCCPHDCMHDFVLMHVPVCVCLGCLLLPVIACVCGD